MRDFFHMSCEVTKIEQLIFLFNRSLNYIAHFEDILKRFKGIKKLHPLLNL